MKTFACQFCHKNNDFSLYFSTCHDCNVEFFVVHNAVSAITYFFNDPSVRQMEISLYHNYTMIFQDQEKTPHKIPQSFANIHPSEALELARKLIKLAVFT